MANLYGPENSPYDQYLLEFKIEFSPEHPFRAPYVKVNTNTTWIFHPNINGDNICLDLLKSNWSPVITITTLLMSIHTLLQHPNASDPLNGDAASAYKAGPAVFMETAKAQSKRCKLTNPKFVKQNSPSTSNSQATTTSTVTDSAMSDVD